jgi:altronate dehydratase
MPPADALLIVVTAPGRAAIVAELFEQLGAVSVLFAAGRGSARPAPSVPASERPDIRIGDDAGMASEA